MLILCFLDLVINIFVYKSEYAEIKMSHYLKLKVIYANCLPKSAN